MNNSRWIAAALAALLGGCGTSPPLRYYALAVVRPATHPRRRPAPCRSMCATSACPRRWIIVA